MYRVGTLLVIAGMMVAFVATGVIAQVEKSGTGTKEVKVTFRNTLAKTVKVYWVNYEGKEESYGEILAGGNLAQDTYETHLWRFKLGDKAVASYRVGSAARQDFDLKKAAAVTPKIEKKPDTKPVTGGTGGTLTDKEAKDVLNYHNKVRKDVGVGAMEWSGIIAKFAQEWADHLASTGKFEHRPRQGKWIQKYGENIAINATILKGAEAWYSEIKDYKAGTAIPADFANFKAGHYTQMVWSKSKKLGVGKAIIQNGDYKGQLMIVANYDPPGNFTGEKPY